MPDAPESGRDPAAERGREAFGVGCDSLRGKTGQKRPDAARNVEADAPRRHHASRIRIERGDPADREAVLVLPLKSGPT
jgi:hypothetical protein